MIRKLRNVSIAVFLATALITPASVTAVDCYYDGLNGIGPNCKNEWEELMFGTCTQCSFSYCMMLGAYADYECISTCIAGAYQSGC